MFNQCSELSLLPDISKWNTNKVTNMSYMFYKCRKLSPLPDISKWNMDNVTKKENIFAESLNYRSRIFSLFSNIFK